nr:MBL fold metallo-hydrolase [uncultured Oscillibacter sp.]
MIPQKHPWKGAPWTLEEGRREKRPVEDWASLEAALNRLGPHDDSFVILEQRQGEDHWFIQSAVVLAGPHAGEYVISSGWSGPKGPSLVERYGDYERVLSLFRGVWENGRVDFTGFEDQSHLLASNQRKQRLSIVCRVAGSLGTNCYFVTDQIAGLTAVIDPGGDAPQLLADLKKLGTRVPYILLTHGHYDHTAAVPALLEALPETEVYIHPKDYPGPDPGLFPLYGQLGGMDCPNIRFFKAFNDRDLPTEEARQLPLGELVIHPIHTPGHSEGSVTLRVSGGPLFCGDSLFAGSCGRTDFPGGNVGKMMSTLRLFGLMDGDAQVFPGHMDFTTLEEERKHNPYLRHALRETP